MICLKYLKLVNLPPFSHLYHNGYIQNTNKTIGQGFACSLNTVFNYRIVLLKQKHQLLKRWGSNAEFDTIKSHGHFYKLVDRSDFIYYFCMHLQEMLALSTDDVSICLTKHTVNIGCQNSYTVRNVFVDSDFKNLWIHKHIM